MNQENISRAERDGFGKVKRVLHTAKILHEGWECDNEAWIVELEDGRVIGLTTSHGSWICKWEIKDAEEYLQFLGESRNSVVEAINILKSSVKG